MSSHATEPQPPRPGVWARRLYAWLAALLLVAGAIVVAIEAASSPLSPPQRSNPVAAEEAAAEATHGLLPTCGVSCDPIDPRYLTDLRFGSTSFWIQPWRAYLDTWPASRLLDAVGINFNIRSVGARDTARLLHDSGFKLARVGINWGGISYDDPHRFVHEAELRERLLALHEDGLRPLLLLNADSGAPCPEKTVALETVTAAPAGARTVTLTGASAAAVVPGRTGFDGVVFNGNAAHRRRHGANAKTTHRKLTHAQRLARKAERRAAGLTALVRAGDPAILIAKVSSSGVATLSRPLPIALPAGAHRGTTLLYAPFTSPTLPGFRATLRGWLGFVATVSKLAEGIFGAGGYDLEVWNELGFDSQFLNAARYYAPAPKTYAGTVTKEVTKALLRETVAYVRDPANGISPNVGITNGFASQTPFPTGAYSPAGLTALSKHPYASAKSIPAEFQVKPGRVPYDALGRRDTAGARGSAGAFTALFVPHLQELFPEYTLTASSGETLIRDIAPITTTIYKAPHGRHVAAAHQTPPQLWVTEYNLGIGHAQVMGPDESTPQTGPAATLTPADRAHFEAKVVLRSLVSMVGKGVAREYFYGAGPGALSLIGEPFFTAASADRHAYPGDALGGETMTGLRNLLGRFHGTGPGRATRQLTLRSISQQGDHAQFAGDGTAAHPSLYDRDVLAVFPFQTSPTSFVIPVYVMTRDLLTLYEPNAQPSDIKRFDLPAESFRITLGNLPAGGPPPALGAYDPLTDRETPARLISRTGSTVTVEMNATDYPRLLSLSFR